MFIMDPLERQRLANELAVNAQQNRPGVVLPPQPPAVNAGKPLDDVMTRVKAKKAAKGKQTPQEQRKRQRVKDTQVLR